MKKFLLIAGAIVVVGLSITAAYFLQTNSCNCATNCQNDQDITDNDDSNNILNSNLTPQEVDLINNEFPDKFLIATANLWLSDSYTVEISSSTENSTDYTQYTYNNSAKTIRVIYSAEFYTVEPPRNQSTCYDEFLITVDGTTDINSTNSCGTGDMPTHTYYSFGQFEIPKLDEDLINILSDSSSATQIDAFSKAESGDLTTYTFTISRKDGGDKSASIRDGIIEGYLLPGEYSISFDNSDRIVNFNIPETSALTYDVNFEY